MGAGPGDPGLLTVRGAEVLRSADLVVFDGLVNPELLRLVPDAVERIAVGRHDGVRTTTQEEVNRLLVEAGLAGRRVARLKGGDPFVFGRGGEEAAALAEAGVSFEIVPGVSSYHAVPAYAGVPVGLGDDAPALMVLSGQEHPDKSVPVIDWPQVARTPGTRVLLMAIQHLAGLTRTLIGAGLPAATPVAVVRRGTTARHATLVGTLGSVVEQVGQQNFGPPAVVVIGDVVRSRDALNWFERRPLFRVRVVLTRAATRMGAMSAAFRDLGAQVWEVPTIRQVPPADPAAMDRALEEVSSYDWIAFTSAAGVDAFFERLLAVHGDIRVLGGARLAAVGPATAARLKELHLRVDAVPPQQVGREIAAAMRRDGDLENLRVLLARAEVADVALPVALTELGAMVDDVAFYRTEADTDDADGWGGRLDGEGADWLVFTSGSTVASFHERFELPELLRKHPRLRVASIGPETTKAIGGIGRSIKIAVEAKPHTTEGLVAGILAAG